MSLCALLGPITVSFLLRASRSSRRQQSSRLSVANKLNWVLASSTVGRGSPTWWFVLVSSISMRAGCHFSHVRSQVLQRCLGRTVTCEKKLQTHTAHSRPLQYDANRGKRRQHRQACVHGHPGSKSSVSTAASPDRLSTSLRLSLCTQLTRNHSP